MFIKAKLRKGLGGVLRRHRQYHMEKGNRVVEILGLDKKI